LISLFIAMMYSHIVNAFSLDNLLLSLRTCSQNLSVVKPSVANEIFLSNNTLSLSLLDDNDVTLATSDRVVVDTSAFDLFECCAI
jgi:hypothetical protein